MNRSAFLLVLPLLAACDVHSKRPADGDENVTIQADDSGHIAFNMPFAEGKVKVPAGMWHNGDVDIDGVKLMPGSSITGFNVNAGDELTTVNLNFTSPATPDEVRSYFLEEFGKKGREVALAGNTVTGTTKDGNAFVIRMTPAANGSQGTIEIQDND